MAEEEALDEARGEGRVGTSHHLQHLHLVNDADERKRYISELSVADQGVLLAAMTEEERSACLMAMSLEERQMAQVIFTLRDGLLPKP